MIEAKEVIDISKLEVLVCVLTVIAIVTAHSYIILTAVHRVEKKIEYIEHICMNNRSIVELTGDYVCKNDAKLLRLLEEILRDSDESEENDDGK